MPLRLKVSKIHKEQITSKVKLCEFFVFLCLCGKIDVSEWIQCYNILNKILAFLVVMSATSSTFILLTSASFAAIKVRYAL